MQVVFPLKIFRPLFDEFKKKLRNLYHVTSGHLPSVFSMIAALIRRTEDQPAAADPLIMSAVAIEEDATGVCECGRRGKATKHRKEDSLLLTHCVNIIMPFRSLGSLYSVYPSHDVTVLL